MKAPRLSALFVVLLEVSAVLHVSSATHLHNGALRGQVGRSALAEWQPAKHTLASEMAVDEAQQQCCGSFGWVREAPLQSFTTALANVNVQPSNAAVGLASGHSLSTLWLIAPKASPPIC